MCSWLVCLAFVYSLQETFVFRATQNRSINSLDERNKHGGRSPVPSLRPLSLAHRILVHFGPSPLLGLTHSEFDANKLSKILGL